MRRTAFLSLLFAAAVAACGDDAVTPNPATYTVVAPTGAAISVRQDLTVRLRDSGMVIVRDGLDTLDGDANNPVTRPNPRMHFVVADPEIAIVDPYGIIRGQKPGQTTVTAQGYDQEVDFTLTVTPYTATTVRLTVATQPNGRLVPQASRTDRGIMWALPADRLSARVEGLVLVGTDTVYCNRCNRKTPERTQRLVNFISLRPELASVRNANNPFVQSTNTTPANTDTAGRILALDTTTGNDSVGIVMEVPSDGLADTVYLRFTLRPIDSLRIDADSADFAPNNIDNIGTQRRKYPNSDPTAGNFVQSATPAFAVNVSYFFGKFETPNFGSQTDASAPVWQTIQRLETAGVERRRLNIPIVTWESALPTYLSMTATDLNVASVTGPCASIDPVCFSPTNQTTRNNLVINCNDTAGKLPGLDANNRPNGGFPVAFTGPGSYTIPGCNPVKTITPTPGAYCSSADQTNLTSTCTIWIRGTIIDPATGLQRRDTYPVNVRR